MTNKQYVFGYGSLIDRTSRTRTNPKAESATPVIVENVARGWWINGNPVGFSTCFLAARVEPGARCNGVIYPITDEELGPLDARERFYERVQIPIADVTLLDGSGSLPDDAVLWFYAVPDDLRAVPSARFPIVQSYVDICMNGCFEIDAAYPLARAANYVEMFLKDTQNWSHYWVNDRLYPRRPHIHVPRAFAIDAALQEHLPAYFNQIQIQPARWDD